MPLLTQPRSAQHQQGTRHWQGGEAEAGGTVLGKYSTVAIRENIMLKFSHLRLLCHVKKVVYRIEYRLQMLSVSVYQHKILILCDAGREKARLSGDQRDPSSPPLPAATEIMLHVQTRSWTEHNTFSRHIDG